MKDGKVKAAVIKSVAAVLCAVLAGYAGITNTEKVCKTNLEIESGEAGEQNSLDSFGDDFDAVFDDAEIEAVQPSDGVTDETQTNGSSSADSSVQSENTSAGNTSSSSGAKSPAKKVITLTGGLNSSDKEEILEYYKLVSKKNANLLFTKTLTLVSLNAGKNMPQKMIDWFIPVAQKALDKNTITNEPYPGKPELIKASDWQAARAVNDGKYTTLYIKVVPQTDSYDGSQFEGTAGRSMGVLDGIDRALQDMGAITVDFSKTKMKIEYINPCIKLKVDNSTGELVKGGCEWGYSTHPAIESMDAKFLAINIHLEDAGGYITYSVKY